MIVKVNNNVSDDELDVDLDVNEDHNDLKLWIMLQDWEWELKGDDEWCGGLLFRAVLMQSDFSITSDLAV